MIDVVVADDQPLIRSALRTLIDSEEDMRVVGEAADGWQAVSVTRAMRCDVTIMDVRMPGKSGIEACREIRSRGAGTSRVLLLTSLDEDTSVFPAMRAGASGFVSKRIGPTSLIEAIRAIHRGDAMLSPSATRALIDRFVMTDDRSSPVVHDLTEREAQVLLEVARGKTNADIALDLTIARATVKTHVNRIMAKVGAHNRAQLVIFAYEAGMTVKWERT